MEIYIHIPFCIKKCDYCDFLSAPSDEKTMERYVEALKKEIQLSKGKMEEYLVDTVFIGGGTPSLLKGKLISSILETLKSACHMKKDAEITIECNPGTVMEEKLLLYKESGINRISFGLQSANDKELKSVGRIHSYEQFLECFHMARKCGFHNINIDIMSALPGQTKESYQKTLEKVIALNPEHISAYSLIVEEETKMFDRVKAAESNGIDILPSEEEERAMYYLTKELLEKAGYKRYEISNYAKQSFECRHNIGYWKRRDYLGLGIGAASLYKEERYNNISDIQLYMDILEKENITEKTLDGVQENKQNLLKEEQMEEFMFLGLRMMKGISVKIFEEKFNIKYEEIYGKVTDKLVRQGLIQRKEEYIRLTRRGIDVSNYVMSEFIF